jgi:signal transduction histidine kinase
VIEDIDKDGLGHFFNTTILPIKDTDDKIVEYIAIRQDISEIFAAKIKATEALEIKTQFLNKVSHELRTPLNAIINFVGQILDDYDDITTDPEFNQMAKNYLQRTENNSKDLLSFINSLLDVAKLEAGKETYTKGAIELASFLHEIHQDTVSLIAGKEIDYSFEAKEKDCFVFADAQKLRQVIINLISNAIKFTSKGFVTIKLNSYSDFYTIEIADSGCGIPEDKLEDVFEAFIQVNSSDSGTGLGLKLVKEYCEAMNIALDFKSKKDEGTTFLLKFNRYKEGV